MLKQPTSSLSETKKLFKLPMALNSARKILVTKCYHNDGFIMLMAIIKAKVIYNLAYLEKNHI